MRFWYFLLVLIAVAGCSSPETTDEVDKIPSIELENLGKAPELTNEVWLNTDKPLRLADLRGQVVLLDMWTFG